MMKGLVEIRSRFNDWQTGEKERLPALLMSL